MLVDAIRPAVAERIFTKKWSYMDVDLCPGGFAILDPVCTPPSTPLLALLSHDHYCTARTVLMTVQLHVWALGATWEGP